MLFKARTAVEVEYKPKVSIILTSYNRPEMLTEAIQSVFSQTMNDWELIIVDDCSPDPEVLKVIKQAIKDPRVKAYQTNYNVNNIAVEWNLGIEKASGGYITLLDNDNRKLPEFCEKMSKYLDGHPENDAVTCFFYIINKKGERTGEVFNLQKNMTKESILLRNHVDSGSMMWRRSVMTKIGWFDERLKTVEDWDFAIRLVHESKGFGVIEEELIEYRWHHENRTFVARGLGLQLHKQFITDIKPYQKSKDVIIFHEDRENITLSQQNVLDGIVDAFKTLDDIQVRTVATSQSDRLSKCDYIFVFAPFSIAIEKLANLRSFAREVMYFHCEDPQAIVLNLERAKYADFISTNDRAAIPMLETVVGRGNVAYCPSISFNDVKLKTRNKGVEKTIDVLFVGYPYESRKKFAKHLSLIADKCQRSHIFRLAFMGDGWKEYLKSINSHARTYDTLDEQKTLQVMEESKIVILYNRQVEDGGDITIPPMSVVRGYFECASGSTVMLDTSRPHHNLDNNVIFYKDADHAKTLIASILDTYDHVIERTNRKNAKETAITLWTYRERIGKLFSIFRNRRFYQEID